MVYKSVFFLIAVLMALMVWLPVDAMAGG